MKEKQLKTPSRVNKIITSILAGLMLFAGAASAQTADLPSPGVTPGSPFFFFDRFFEGLGGIFAFGQAAKARRAVAIAEERLSEARALLAIGDEGAEEAIELYEEKLAEAAERAQNAKNADALARVTEATSKHFAVLEDVIERVPEQAKAAVQRALESSKQGQVSALQALKGEDPSRALDAGLAAMKAHTQRAKANAERGRPNNAEQAADDFQRVLAAVSDAPRGRGALEIKISEGLTEIVDRLDEATDLTEDMPASLREALAQAREATIDAHLTSLRELAREDPAKAVEIFADAAEGRLNAAKKDAEERNGEATEKSLEEYNKYAEFGQQISSMAQGIRTGDVTVEDLVKKATSLHLRVLEDVRQKLPSNARQEFQRALDSARKVQELRPAIPPQSRQQAPTQPGARQQISLPPKTGEPVAQTGCCMSNVCSVANGAQQCRNSGGIVDDSCTINNIGSRCGSAAGEVERPTPGVPQQVPGR